MNGSLTLSAEWNRIDLLGAFASAYRQGAEIPEELGERLNVVQGEVDSIRQGEPWRSVVEEFGFATVDQDILACALAPLVEPRLGWMYQGLQPGIVSPYPTPALIRELFVLNHDEIQIFNQHLSADSPLWRSGMLEGNSASLFEPIRPLPYACEALLGWSTATTTTIPGALEVPTQADWNDLVLPPRCIKNLRAFILWVTHRRQVEDEWGGKVSGGPLALFSGASGTGKSYAAEVVANALGWPLFRVDLGLLVSKYIGETEKNLNALFDAADSKNAVLLFDEADSLFSKRGEVKEARDRYANMEVSHLLSRIERHRGPCILTSNLRQHIDPAFTRRFQVVIDFPSPDEAARAQLWKMNLPPRAPRTEEVDTRLLGKEFKLSGGQIKNAALHASFLAAGEAAPISLAHITSAVWTEFAKKGGEMSSVNLGNFARYLPSEEVS